MYFIPVGEKFGHNPRHVMEDAYDGLYQLAHNPLLLIAFCGTAISIAFFNFAGRGLGVGSGFFMKPENRIKTGFWRKMKHTKPKIRIFGRK